MSVKGGLISEHLIGEGIQITDGGGRWGVDRGRVGRGREGESERPREKAAGREGDRVGSLHAVLASPQPA